MRVISAALFIFFGGLVSSAHADPYRWCADYGGRGGGGGTSCYFRTFDQCLASISGRGGFCRPNPFYDGRPVVTPEDRPVRRKRRHY
jgi:hypothetical protein